MKTYSFYVPKPLLIIANLMMLALFVGSIFHPELFATGVSVAVPSLLTQAFSKDIQEALYPDNEFYKNSIDDSAYVNNDTVNLPQAGSAPGTQKNRTTIPATATKRSDTAEDYKIDEFTTDPIYIQDSEELVVSYNKRKSILAQHQDKLNLEIANNFAYVWANGLTVATNIVRTSGAIETAPLVPAATGNRKRFVKADLINIFNIMNRMDIPMTGRLGVLPADMYADLLVIEEFVSAEKIGESALKKGIVGRLFGFDIYMRSSVLSFTSAAAVRAPGEAGAATDNAGGLFWHPNFVRRAEGSVKVYSDLDNPLYYGSIFSAMVRAGGRRARTDMKGIVGIVQSA